MPLGTKRRVEGVGLHGGVRGALTFEATQGPTTLGRGDDRAELAALDVRGDDRSTIARLPSGAEVRSIEHLLAAIAGAGAFDGVRIDVEGYEVPLLDGCARVMMDAIDRVLESVGDRAICAREARVVREASIEALDARYSFSSGEGTELQIDVDFDASRFGRPLRGEASWRGDVESFRTSIATARTFGAARELQALRARGLAAHVPEGIVVALDLDDPARAPSDAGEPIRHKLLDLIGDLGRLGAPLIGRLHAHRPSHRASDAVLRRALADGVIVVGRATASAAVSTL